MCVSSCHLRNTHRGAMNIKMPMYFTINANANANIFIVIVHNPINQCVAEVKQKHNPAKQTLNTLFVIAQSTKR